MRNVRKVIHMHSMWLGQPMAPHDLGCDTSGSRDPLPSGFSEALPLVGFPRLHDEIVTLRPDWHHPDDARGRIKVIMSGDASDTDWQAHIRSKSARRDLKLRAKDPDDELELVIVVDMWLTGFDSPPMHTMYVDKHLKAHNLMQAIARVNRTWRDKPAGLVVDYIGITDDLRRALANYSSDDQDRVGIDLDDAVAVLERAHDVVCGLLNGHDWPRGETDVGTAMAAVTDTVEWLLDHDVPTESVEHEDQANDLVDRFKDQTLALAKAHALAASHPRARELADDVNFLLTVRAHLVKTETTGEGTGRLAATDTALRQLVSASITTDGVVDVFAEAGLSTPDLSIFSDEFLDRIQEVEGQDNLRIRMLQKLIDEEVRSLRRVSVVRHEKFSEQLQRAINRYRTRALTSAQIIEELVELARELRAASEAGVDSGMTREEYAFYEAVAQNGAAIAEMGDDKLRALASELVASLKREVTIDWDRKANVQAAIRAKVSRLLMLRGYPPDYSEEAIQLVLAQTELFAREWVGAA